MTPFEVKKALENMVLLVDTREQDTKALHRRTDSTGLPYERVKLDAGDYSASCPLLSLKGVVAIERKMSADELALCFGKERDRFEREFERAKASGTRIYLLVENTSFENLYAHKYRSLLSPNAFIASIFAWMARYDCRIILCKAETTGKIIRDILYRELKERLESEEDNGS